MQDNSVPSRKDLIAWARRHSPNALDRFYPRRFRSVKGWSDPLFAAAQSIAVLTAALNYTNRKRIGDGIVTRFAASWALAIERKTPTWFVGEDFAAAMLRTKPTSLPSTELKFAQPSMLFMLPQAILTSYLGLQLEMLLVAKLPANTIMPLPLEKSTPVQLLAGPKGEDEIVVIATDDTSTLWTWHTPVCEDNLINDFIPDCDYAPESEHLEDDMKYMNSIGWLGMNLACALGVHSLIESPQIIMAPHTTGKNGNVVRHTDGLFEPRWLGRNYRLPVRCTLGGTHASPIAHWRCGFWRHQRYGPSNSLLKTIWIEPVLVNAELTV